jgi:predicted ABC-type ATPase
MIKKLEIIAGPNGSGKSTFAEAYLQDKKDALFINSDNIAKGIAPQNIDLAAFEAGRFMLEAISNALEKNESFLFETTLSGKAWIQIIKKAKERNYYTSIYFVFLMDVNLNLQRIKERVRKGGHNVPEDVVRRRYSRSFKNFWNIYKELVDEWFVVENTGESPVLIAQKAKGVLTITREEVINEYFGGN